MTAQPRVALLSVGMGRVRRGFERYFGELFHLLQSDVDLICYGSAGEDRVRRRVPGLLKTATAIARTLPLGKLAGSAEYNRDCLAFGLCLLPELATRRFDVLHCIDPPLAFLLGHFRRLGIVRSQLLFTEGCVMPPEYYPHADHIHHVGYAAWQGAIESGVPESKMTLVPCGFHPEQFLHAGSKRELRRRYGIPDDRFIVMSVSAVKRAHKRVDHIVQEFTPLPPNALLWLDGNPEDPELIAETERLLGDRCRITHLESDKIAELYAIADVFVHASLTESFGLSLIEATAAGVPVLANAHPHFEWLMGDRGCLLDMAAPGALSKRLAELMQSHEELRAGAAARSERVRQRFDWRNLRANYVSMYRKVAASQ